jgi:hypothetical protein
MEKGLARGLSLVISFLAQLLHLSGITNKIKAAIEKIRTKVDDVLLKVAKWIFAQTKKLIGAGIGAGKAAVGAVFEWWKKKMKVGTGKNAHTIYFRGDQESAVLYIESTPRILREYIVGLRNDINFTGPEQVKTMGRIEKKIGEIETWRGELRAANQRRQVNVVSKKAEEISAGFDYIGEQLGQLFLGDTYGTEADPIPLEWPGPSSDSYPEMYFGGRLETANRPKKQSVMKAIHNQNQKDETKTPITKYTPHGGGSLKGGGDIGLKPAYYVTVGKIVGPLSQETTTGGGKLGKLIEPYGFSAEDEGMQLDHVHEIQFGGLAKNDTVGNLWPLPQRLNSIKGSKLSKANVEYPRGHLVKIPTLKTIKNEDVNQNKKFFFKIQKVG